MIPAHWTDTGVVMRHPSDSDTAQPYALLANDQTGVLALWDGISLRSAPRASTTRALLAQRIEASGLSIEDFNRAFLHRNERTIYRWLAGDSPIPVPVVAFLSSPPSSITRATPPRR